MIQDGKYLTNEPKTDFNNPDYLEIDSEITDIYKTAYNITNHHAYLNNSKATVLTNGKEMFPKLIKEIKEAKEYILMEYFIIRTDKIGKKVLNLLIKKAKEGVDVKLIYDSIGSVMLNKKFMRNLRKSKVQVVVNDRVYFGLFNTRVNYRNHRKITVIDGKYGFIGGMNLADEYNNGVKKFGHFRDTHLVIEGLAINSITSLFFRDWYYNTNTFIDDKKYYNAVEDNTEGLVQIIPSGPDFNYPPIRNTYVKMINNAKVSLKIMTPYLALDQQMLTSLIIASKGGVKVDIIIPGIPDKKSVYLVTKSFIGELLEAGINIYFYKKGFTHAKVLISDDTLASCGTYNLDNRSAVINFEVTALLYKTGVEKLIKDFDKDLSISKKVNSKKWNNRGIINKIFEGMFNLFSPLV
ncbi:MAG: cardiolipin synthase [Bacteroidales bacterium]|nr:cardiolipin synthase [Bacteroidales bacterium]